MRNSDRIGHLRHVVEMMGIVPEDVEIAVKNARGGGVDGLLGAIAARHTFIA